MKSTTFVLILLSSTLLISGLLIFGGQGTLHSQEKQQDKAQELSQLAVVVTKVNDLDSLDGYVLSKPKRDVRIVLAQRGPPSGVRGPLLRTRTPRERRGPLPKGNAVRVRDAR